MDITNKNMQLKVIILKFAYLLQYKIWVNSLGKKDSVDTTVNIKIFFLIHLPYVAWFTNNKILLNQVTQLF